MHVRRHDPCRSDRAVLVPHELWTAHAQAVANPSGYGPLSLRGTGPVPWLAQGVDSDLRHCTRGPSLVPDRVRAVVKFCAPSTARRAAHSTRTSSAGDTWLASRLKGAVPLLVRLIAGRGASSAARDTPASSWESVEGAVVGHTFRARRVRAPFATSTGTRRRRLQRHPTRHVAQASRSVSGKSEETIGCPTPNVRRGPMSSPDPSDGGASFGHPHRA